MSESWVRQRSERALLLEAHHTTHIEGTRLTLDQSEQLLAGQPVPEADADDVRELLNYRAMASSPTTAPPGASCCPAPATSSSATTTRLAAG